MLRQSVDDEGEEECEDGKDDQSDDKLLELLPDEEDEGLHRVDEPGEAGGWTTKRIAGDSLHLFPPELSLRVWSLQFLKMGNFTAKSVHSNGISQWINQWTHSH